jgi:hypothetical protein
MMVKVLVYGYATGVFSTRKIKRRLHEDLVLRMLSAGNFPRHPDHLHAVQPGGDHAGGPVLEVAHRQPQQQGHR